MEAFEMTDFGQVAFIDLARKSTSLKPISEQLVRRFIGGRGLNVYLLYKYTKPGIDPLGPDNVLILGAGPLCGTPSPSASRINVSGKSPLTHFLGDTNCGGFWGPELRFAGYDHLVFQNRAEKPTYIYIYNDKIEFRDASHLWGLDSIKTQAVIRDELGPEVHTVCIGQAGENLVRFASVRTGAKHSAARTGMGAVMGSKNLKAVAVKGTKGVPIYNPHELLEHRKQIEKRSNERKVYKLLKKYGTTYLLDAHQGLGTVGGYNHQHITIEEDKWEAVGQKAFKEHSKAAMAACFGCFLHCSLRYEVPYGEFKGSHAEGPEYFSIAHLGAEPGVLDAEAIQVSQDLCNRLGMDATQAGDMIAWAMELFQRGIIDEESTGGLKLEWGDEELVLRLLKDMALRRGFGDILADSGLTAAQKIGGNSEDYFIHVKGQTCCTDERGLMGCALNIATASRGADHLRSRPIPEGMFLPEKVLEDIYGGFISNKGNSYEGKARMVAVSEKWFVIPDCLEICRMLTKGFVSPGMLGFKDHADLLRAVTGIDMSGDELMEAAERIITLERLYNLREGLKREDDTLPKRYFEEVSEPAGIVGGNKVDRDKFSKMLDEYYEYLGWNRKGVPKKDSLRRLGLEKINNEPSDI
jgi:aldehyde:ferredoxin oxidoreductase